MTAMLKKVSPKTLNCQQIGDGYKLFAKIGSYKEVSTNLGISYQLFGIVRAIVDSTGEVFEGISTFIPGGYDALFVQQLKSAQDQNKNASIVIQHHFALNEAKNPMGKEWIMTTLNKDTGGSTALDELQNSALPSPKETLKLAAPAKETAKKAAK